MVNVTSKTTSTPSKVKSNLTSTKVSTSSSVTKSKSKLKSKSKSKLKSKSKSKNKSKSSSKQQGKSSHGLRKFILNCSVAANDHLFDPVQFEEFLNHRIKVDHRVHNLGKSVKVQRSGHQAVTIYTTIPFSKRYYKYLTKKFLKKVNLRDWLRVVATDKQSFELKYFNVDEKEK
ncbi:hypothetical protein HMI56_005059 [Coelomomyces lativittatus]|nr:hypothetical protein HMI56_005059 [Coelomomyces lativittatus]